MSTETPNPDRRIEETEQNVRLLRSQLMSLPTVTAVGNRKGRFELTVTAEMHDRPGAYGYTKWGGHRRPEDYPHVPQHVYRLADRFDLEVVEGDRKMSGTGGYKRIFQLIKPEEA